VTVWGISCNVEGGELVVIVVAARKKDGAIEHQVVLKHITDPGEDAAKKLMSVGADVETALRNEHVDVAIVRSRDRSPVPRGVTNEDETRYHAQGVVLGVVRRKVDRVEVRNGKEIGSACHSDKPTIEAETVNVFGKELKDAGMAALAALAIAEA